MRLRFTRRAAQELDQVLSYIEGRSSKGARDVKARIQAVIDLIAAYPQSGQLTSSPAFGASSSTPSPT
ncbi:MAG TPA: type II toxin-antitoxin system RelE/ParE family toxin [Roseiarcus sp.]|nr:type II toxin-antitoxin system RelE/ParE family toxin [Roseiarcus sp.]